MLIAYDWGEAFAALNLTVKPVFDAVFNIELAELARTHEDALLALILDDFELDGKSGVAIGPQRWSNMPRRSVPPIQSCSKNG